MAASSSGGRSEIWQRVDRRNEKSKVDDFAAGDVPGSVPAPEAEVADDWIHVVNRKNKRKVEATAQGKSLRGKDSGRFLDRSSGSNGADRRSNSNAGAVPNHASKVFDRRALRPKTSVVINPITEKRSWLDVCASRRKISSFLEMNLVSPLCELDGVMIADVPNCLVDEAAGRWKHTLVGFVLGDVPFFGQILAWARRSWRLKQEVRIFSKENGFFYFQFGNEEDRDGVLRNGPWLFDGRLVVLQRWGVNIGFERDFLSSVPVWIRIPHLPLHLWSAKILSIITSVIGSPICLDRATASMDRIAYARCLVEVNAAVPLARHVMVRHEDGTLIRVEVEYEGEPPRCCSCLCFGHTVAQCSVVGSGSKHGFAANGAAGAVNSDLLASSMAADNLQGKNSGEIYKDKLNVSEMSHVNDVPCVKDGLLAVTRVVNHAKVVPHVEEVMLDVSRLSEMAHSEVGNELLKGVVADSMEFVLDEQCNVVAHSVLVGGQEVVGGGDPVSIVVEVMSGDGCKETVDVAKSVNTCIVQCDVKLAGASEDVLLAASSSCCSAVLAAPSMTAACKGLDAEIGREQKCGSDSGTFLSPEVDVGDVGRSLASVGLDDLCLVDDGVGRSVLTVKGLLVNGGDFSVDDSVSCSSVVSTSLPAQPSHGFGPLRHDVGFGVGSDVRGIVASVGNSPPPASVHSPPSEPVLPPPPEPGLSPPPVPDSPPPGFGIGSEVVGRGLSDVDVGSVAEGFNLGIQFLSGSMGDKDASFEFTKINDAWLLEQEDAKQSNVKTKKSNPSLVGTRKSVRFGGGSGPTPPARFRK